MCPRDCGTDPPASFPPSNTVPQSRLNRDTTVQKEKRFYSQLVPFIHYRGKVEAPVTEGETAYGIKREFIGCRRERRERNRRCECFLSTFSLLSVSHFFTFQGKNFELFLTCKWYYPPTPTPTLEDIFKIWNDVLLFNS